MPMRHHRFCNLWISQKHKQSKYLENEKLFSLQIKKFINNTSGATLWQKIVL